MSRLRLVSIIIKEFINNQPIYLLDKVCIDDFNLLIGDNAQGKTRFLNTFNFLYRIFSGQKITLASNFEGIFNFQYQDNEEKLHSITYTLKILPANQTNSYSEQIINNGFIILDTEKKILFNELKKIPVESFFSPTDLPSAYAINGEEFLSINLIRAFFQRILLIGANKKRDIDIIENALIVNMDGANVGKVLENWKIKYPSAYNETIRQFKKCFAQINTIEFIKPANLPINILALSEDGISERILQDVWSDGFLRALCLFAVPNTPFDNEGAILPSLILIDEIENGLDYKTLEKVVDYLKELSDEIQFIVTSHSPLLCDFVEPRSWRIVKRLQSKVSMLSPAETESDLKKILAESKMRHWDFYSKHISKSNLYRVK